MKTIISSVIEKLEVVKNNIDDETFYPTNIREAVLDLGSMASALLLAVIGHKINQNCDKTIKSIKSRWC